MTPARSPSPPASASASSSRASSPAPRKPDFRAPPPSDLLNRLNAFLPQLRAANEALATAPPEKVNIEHVDEEEEAYVEMNLGLGVLEEVPEGRRGEGEGEGGDVLAAILQTEKRRREEEAGGKEEGRGKEEGKEGVLEEMMGRKEGKKKVGIQVVDDEA